ncbi:hypothetical protein ABZ801_30620 [Actinomadura sp. NPDC047616]|uniref:hypothetical protein n=1 Tax=Actinomadura sp. NPDC047616 TaxID=3155914 RepID=UPI0033DFE5B2
MRALVARAAALIAQITDQVERETAIDRQAFAEGYRIGFAAGREVGYGQAEADMQRAWSAVAATIRREANQPKFQELEARRYPDRTPAQLTVMRGRDRYPLPDRQCHTCGGRVCGCGGAA